MLKLFPNVTLTLLTPSDMSRVKVGCKVVTISVVTEGGVENAENLYET